MRPCEWLMLIWRQRQTGFFDKRSEIPAAAVLQAVDLPDQGFHPGSDVLQRAAAGSHDVVSVVVFFVEPADGLYEDVADVRAVVDLDQVVSKWIITRRWGK